MADEPEKMEEELRLLRERRRMSRCNRTYSLFLDGLETASGLPREQAQRVFVSVLCAFEQPLIRDTADEWRARLPVKLREALQACASRRGSAPELPSLEAVLRRVEADIGGDRPRAESVTRAIFSTLRAHITEGEADQVADALPPDFQALWARAC
ncbi:DUF2267 domain-containing protein [Melittangium boletus]|uniref:CBS domain pair protein n=1 Tax=Melittangium boletus DSM 14713 TaxID=1294270 RepID=A0A250I8P0_9BACT|nr:DUF2267 domain-containing protein [Melittangium boletus]ATB27497.1 CBS domain pair protein [Melittangium boletus DSM 14713]